MYSLEISINSGFYGRSKFVRSNWYWREKFIRHNIEESLDINLVGITQNTPVRITQERIVPTKAIDKNKESESTILDIQDSTVRNTMS